MIFYVERNTIYYCVLRVYYYFCPIQHHSI